MSLVLLSGAAAPDPQQTPPGAKPLIACSNEELLQRVPELKGLRPERGDALLRSTLKALATALDDSMDSFENVAALETISSSRFDAAAGFDAREERFRHVFHWPTGHVTGSDDRRLHETRLDEHADKAAAPGGGYLLLGRFMNLVEFLLPENQDRSRFRAAGRIACGDSECVVLLYAYLPDSKFESGIVASASAPPEPLQGAVWVDARTGAPRRILAEPLRDLSGHALSAFRATVDLAPVRFAAQDATVLLPWCATLQARIAGADIYAAHRFTAYRLYGGATSDAGTQSIPATEAGPALYESLSRALQIYLRPDYAGAATALREVLAKDPAFTQARLVLGLALAQSGDAAAAETEIRSVVQQAGESAPAHAALGSVLLRRGEAREAAAEFEHAARLAPKQPALRVNLAQAFERLGNTAGAIAQYRAALELDPANASAKARLEQLTQAPQSAELRPDAGPVIRVDVRQVMVPVVVRDSERHCVTGLKQSDFRVLEDGVEQTLTAFQVETSGSADVGPASASPTSPGPTPAAPPAPTPGVRHTYLICVDTLHSSFSNMHAAREALQKFLASERPGDSQYALVSLGRSLTILENLTTDPARILAALDDKHYLKMVSGGNQSAWAGDLKQYFNELAEIRSMLDSSDPRTRQEGAMRMKLMPAMAEQLAAEDRMRTVALLDELKSLVKQLAAKGGHRTLVLLSDGFHLSAGREPWGYLVAFLPELSQYAPRGGERLSSEFDGVVRTAARSNVVINTVDSRGLYVSSVNDASIGSMGGARAMPRIESAVQGLETEAGFALSELAAATGGTSFQNSNDLTTGVQRAIADGRDYYTLAYVSTNPNLDGKFRKIEVIVKGRKLTVQAKRGYWATEN